MSGGPKRALIVIAVVAVAALGAAGPAQATFPGSNGEIAFSQGDLLAPIGGEPGDLSAHSQVFTINPDGSGLKRLTNVARDQGAGSPDWSPDGRKIAYESNESGAFHVWVMNANGSHQTQLTFGDAFEDFQPSWSPNGKRIIFSHCSEPFGDGFLVSCDLVVIKADGSCAKTLPNPGHWTNVRPGYSPDGKRITFSSDRGGLASAVWVMNSDGSSPKRLTAPALRAFWPDWAPDGKRILFGDHCCIPHSNLWTVRPDGSGLHQVTDVPGRLDAAFSGYSPDGRRIVTFFSKGCADSPCKHFYTLRADGTHFNRVVTAKTNTFLTDWGPRG